MGRGSTSMREGKGPWERGQTCLDAIQPPMEENTKQKKIKHAHPTIGGKQPPDNATKRSKGKKTHGLLAEKHVGSTHCTAIIVPDGHALIETSTVRTSSQMDKDTADHPKSVFTLNPAMRPSKFILPRHLRPRSRPQDRIPPSH